MRLLHELLRATGFNVQMRKLRILSRIRDLVTLTLIMGSIGTAIGYAVARRGPADTDREG